MNLRSFAQIPRFFTRCRLSRLNCWSAQNATFFMNLKKNKKQKHENSISCGRAGPLITTSTCSELWRRLRNTLIQVDSSRLFYLCKFNFVVHTKCWEKAFWIEYEAKFIKVKQARSVKPDIMCSAIYVTTYSKPKENWCQWWAKKRANLKAFKS